MVNALFLASLHDIDHTLQTTLGMADKSSVIHFINANADFIGNDVFEQIATNNDAIVVGSTVRPWDSKTYVAQAQILT